MGLVETNSVVTLSSCGGWQWQTFEGAAHDAEATFPRRGITASLDHTFLPPFYDPVIQSPDISAPPSPVPVSRPNPPISATTLERGHVIPDLPSAPTSPAPVVPATLSSLLYFRPLYPYIL